MTSHQYFGKDPDTIQIPYTKEQTHFLLQTWDVCGVTLSGFWGMLNNHLPGDHILQFA